MISLFKITDLQRRIANPDADQLDLAFKSGIAFDFAIHLIDGGSLPLTEGSINVEYFNNNNFSLNLGNGERIFPCYA